MVSSLLHTESDLRYADLLLSELREDPDRDDRPVPQPAGGHGVVASSQDRHKRSRSRSHSRSRHGDGRHSGQRSGNRQEGGSRSGQHKRPRSVRTPSPEPRRVQYKGGGYDPPVGGHAQASDYIEAIETLINAAVDRFEVKLYTNHAFPSHETALEWSQEAWIVTCQRAKQRFHQDGVPRILKAVSAGLDH